MGLILTAIITLLPFLQRAAINPPPPFTEQMTLTLVMMGGGGLKVPPPLYLFVKTIEKVQRLCTVLKKILDWQF